MPKAKTIYFPIGKVLHLLKYPNPLAAIKEHCQPVKKVNIDGENTMLITENDVVQLLLHCPLSIEKRFSAAMEIKDFAIMEKK